MHKLALLALLAAIPARAQSWRVVTDAYADSTLRAGIDTATVEGGWCANADIDQQAHTLTLTQVIEAPYVSSTGHESHFACPKGAVIIHRHLASVGAVHGPSYPDKQFFFRCYPQPPAGIIVYRGTDGVVEYIAYFVHAG